MGKKKDMEEYVFMVMKKKDYELLKKSLKKSGKNKGRTASKGRGRDSKSFENYLCKLTKKIEDHY
jgi:hypothetical protein